MIDDRVAKHVTPTPPNHSLIWNTPSCTCTNTTCLFCRQHMFVDGCVVLGRRLLFFLSPLPSPFPLLFLFCVWYFPSSDSLCLFWYQRNPAVHPPSHMHCLDRHLFWHIPPLSLSLTLLFFSPSVFFSLKASSLCTPLCGLFLIAPQFDFLVTSPTTHALHMLSLLPMLSRVAPIPSHQGFCVPRGFSC